MTENNPPYHYNYSSLDKLLHHGYDPQDIGDQLDETISDLVSYAGKEEDFCQRLPEKHNILRELRDIFWNLKTSAHGDSRN